MATATASPAHTRPPVPTRSTVPAAKLTDQAPGIRGFMLFDGLVRLLLWQASLALTVMFFNVLDAWPARSPIGADWHTTWKLGEKLGHMVLVFKVEVHD